MGKSHVHSGPYHLLGKGVQMTGPSTQDMKRVQGMPDTEKTPTNIKPNVCQSLISHGCSLSPLEAPCFPQEGDSSALSGSSGWEKENGKRRVQKRKRKGHRKDCAGPEATAAVSLRSHLLTSLPIPRLTFRSWTWEPSSSCVSHITGLEGCPE